MLPNIAELPECLNIKYSAQTLNSIPVYDETLNTRLDEAIRHILVVENLHRVREVCDRARDMGIPCSPYVVLAKLQNGSDYVQIQDGVWEDRVTLADEVERYILAHTSEFKINKTRAMPEIEEIIRPAEMCHRIPRYSGMSLDEKGFGQAVIESIHLSKSSNLIAVHGVIVNFKEAFTKDVYNVILRERAPLSSLDIALRLFDSKVGVYKKSLKDFVFGRKRKDVQKVMHHPLHPHEVFRLSRVIEKIVGENCVSRPEIFIRLDDGRVNAYRNHIGIIRIKMDQDNYLVINMTDEFEIARNVEKIIDANKAFLNQLTNQFRAKIEEDEIESRFYEKLWQAVIQYDEVWGHKFHTFLHRALKNILIDEQTKRDKLPSFTSLNSTVNDKGNEEFGDVYRDRHLEISRDPARLVHDNRLHEMIRKSFSNDEQEVLFLIIDGMKDKDIAAALDKSVPEIVSIKKTISRRRELLNWLSR